MLRLLFVIPLALCLWFVPAPARAAAPPLEPLQSTLAQTGTFELIDYENPDAEDLPTGLFYSPDFINRLGSAAVTVNAMITHRVAFSVLGLITLIFMALIFMFTYIANRKIDNRLGGLNSEIEKHRAQAATQVNAAQRGEIERNQRDLEGQVNDWRSRRVSYTPGLARNKPVRSAFDGLSGSINWRKGR